MPRRRKILPPEFTAAVELWQQADLDVPVSLARFRTAPNPVNRLAVIMAWAALRVPLETLASRARQHPQTIDATAWALARSEELRIEIERWGLLEEGWTVRAAGPGPGGAG